MCNLVFSVPPELWQEFISPFLTLKMLVNVETAFGCSNLRKDFHVILNGMVFKDLKHSGLPLHGVLWLQRNVVLLKDVKLWQEFSNQMLASIDFHGFCAEVVHLRNCRRLSSEAIQQFTICCTHLRSLDISGCEVSSELLSALGHHCTPLKCLTVSINGRNNELLDWIASSLIGLTNVCLYGYGTVCDDQLARFCARLSHMQIIDMGFCELECNCIHVISQHCLALRELTLQAYSSLRDEDLLKLSEHCPHLKSLTVGGSTAALSARAVSQFVSSCQHVHSIKVPNFDRIMELAALGSSLCVVDIQGSKITDDELEILAQHCPNIQRINLCNCRYISDAGLIGLVEHCRDLRELRVGQDCGLEEPHGPLSDAIMIAISKHCKMFECLQTAATDTVSNQAIIALSLQCPMLKRLELTCQHEDVSCAVAALLSNCAHLECLHLHLCAFTGLPALLHPCGSLRELYLDNCSYRAPILVAIAGCSRNLTRIILSNDAVIDDASLVTVFTHCRRVQKLHLISCTAITGAAVVHAAQLLGKRLVGLEINGIAQVADATVLAVAHHCPHLRELTLIDLPLLTGASIAALSAHDVHLLALVVYRCHSIPQICVQDYATKYPNCAI